MAKNHDANSQLPTVSQSERAAIADCLIPLNEKSSTSARLKIGGHVFSPLWLRACLKSRVALLTVKDYPERHRFWDGVQNVLRDAHRKCSWERATSFLKERATDFF